MVLNILNIVSHPPLRVPDFLITLLFVILVRGRALRRLRFRLPSDK